MTIVRRTIIALAFGLVGLICALSLVLWGNTRDLVYVNVSELVMVQVSGPCAMVAGWLCAGLFGRQGRWGWVAAGFGAILTTAIGAGIAGFLFWPPMGAVIAPMTVLENFMTLPLTGTLWLICMILLNFLILKTVSSRNL